MTRAENITVCIPTRNAEQYLPDCFRTLIAQTVQPAEYLICIGKSTDRTEELVKDFQRQIQIPVRIFYDNEGIGTAFAMRLMIENAESAYIMWVSSDFILPVNWIEAQRTLVKSNPELDIISSNQIQISLERALKMRRENKFPDKIMSSLRVKDGIVEIGSIIKRETIFKAGGFDISFKRGQDKDLMFRFKIIGAKGAKCDELKYLHSGLIGRYDKAMTRSTFLSFIYKYGLRYIPYEMEHFAAFLLRVSFLISLFSLLPLYFFDSVFTGLSYFAVSSFILLFGVVWKHGFSLSVYLIQIGKCFGEIYSLYKIFRDKDRKGHGYGREIWLKDKSKSGVI